MPQGRERIRSQLASPHRGLRGPGSPPRPPCLAAILDLTPEFDLPSIDTEQLRRRLGMRDPASVAEHRDQRYALVRTKCELGVHQLAGDHCIQACDDEGFAAHIDGLALRYGPRPVGA